MKTKSKWLVFIISMSLAAVALAAAGPGYHVVTTYKVGGDGGWDYLTTDAEARRTYISRGTHVMVVDTTQGNGEVFYWEAFTSLTVLCLPGYAFEQGGVESSNPIVVYCEPDTATVMFLYEGSLSSGR